MIPERYNRSNLIAALHEPGKFFDEFKRICNRLRHAPAKFLFHLKYTPESDLMKEDWDNLIILDSCRHDVLNELKIFGNIDSKILKSSTSEEFIEEYFEEYEFSDTIYITANPYGARVTDTFFKKVSTFNETFTDNKKKAKVDNLGRGWEPELVYDTTINAYDENPNKRFVIHFMQPHSPYFGKKARMLRKDLREEGYRFWAWSDDIDRTDKVEKDNILYSLQQAAKEEIITKDKLYDIYKENIFVVMEFVEELSGELDGKTVVTADHGEMLGDSKLFVPQNLSGLNNNMGHGDRIYTKELRKVPWVVLDHTKRRKIIDGAINETDNKIVDIENRLRALGYK